MESLAVEPPNSDLPLVRDLRAVLEGRQPTGRVARPNPQTVKLHEFERALEDYTAAMLWAGKGHHPVYVALPLTHTKLDR